MEDEDEDEYDEEEEEDEEDEGGEIELVDELPDEEEDEEDLEDAALAVQHRRAEPDAKGKAEATGKRKGKHGAAPKKAPRAGPFVEIEYEDEEAEPAARRAVATR